MQGVRDFFVQPFLVQTIMVPIS